MPLREIFGHRRTLGLLSRAIAQESLPQSLLFTGPEGIGKVGTAFAVAQLLNCPAPLREVSVVPDSAGATIELPLDACGLCVSCRRIARRIHPDIKLIAPVERVSITIEQIRELNEQVGYRPFEARRRVVIIDNAAELLGPSAQNGLLKTLEEPPSATTFILVTANPEALLATVRSRCSLMRFAPLAADDVVSCLEAVHGLKPSDARARAAVADGSVGVALASGELAQARAGAQRVLEYVARVREPRSRLEITKEMTGKAPKGSGQGERDSLAVYLRLLQGLLRDVGLLSTSADVRALAHADLEPALARLVPAFDRARLLGAFTAVDRALGALEGNASPKIVADWLVLQL
jgi:DNA polymerase III subunit delta'